MNEEQAVLDFFAQEENVPLALIAAEHLDAIRLRLNNQFWQLLGEQLTALLTEQALPWTAKQTDDRNVDDCQVGLHLEPTEEGRIFLRPFMEQQFIGNDYRIFHGLMWSGPAEIAQKALPPVSALSTLLQEQGFKQGDNFFAWQWLPWHPRRRDFLMEFHTRRDQLLADALKPWHYLLVSCGPQLQAANEALRAPTSNATSISLDQLRSKLPSQNAS